MKIVIYLALVTLAVCFAACGGGESTYDITVDNATIGGKLSQYFTLVDKTYKYNQEEYHGNVIVELKCIQPLPEDLSAYIGVDVLDEDGTVISSQKAESWSFADYEVLRQASPDEIVTIKIKNRNKIENSNPAKIRLTSIVNEVKESSYSSSSSSKNIGRIVSVAEDSDNTTEAKEVAESSSSSSEDFDAVLDSYEKYVDKYISFMKKASNGDLTAMAEYPSLLQQAEEFGDKLERAKGDLTASQMARFNKIQAKMLKAAQEMK